MNGPMREHEYTTGRQWWLVIVLAPGLALGSQAAAVKECHRETALPAGVRLSALGPEVPEAVARLAGVWIGAWLDREREALCHALVVEKVLANGYARGIFSHGTSADWNQGLPNFWYVTGRIIDGALRFRLPVPGGPELAYRLPGETLQGTFQGEGRVNLTRMADMRQVACGEQAGGLPPAPPGPAID